MIPRVRYGRFLSERPKKDRTGELGAAGVGMIGPPVGADLTT